MTVESSNSSDQVVSIPSAWKLNWMAWDTSKDGNVPGPVLKVLRHDEQTGGMTFITHIPPGWQDHKLVWHPATEEGLRLSGATRLADNDLPTACYLYRPPGILHGPASSPFEDGATLLQRTNANLRILRYDGDEFPHEPLQPITDDHKTWPVEWQEHLETDKLEWVPVTSGGWAGTSAKWIHRHKVTGGGAAMLQIPAGWRGQGSLAHGPIEEFVIEGSIVAGGQEYGKWGYSFRPAGMPLGAYHSEEGAVLFCWWDGGSELD